MSRPVRHVALATGLVLVVCALIGGWSLASYRSANGHLRVLTGRGSGVVTGVDGGSAVVVWSGGRSTVRMSDAVPPAGTATEVAYDPARPSDAVIPGAALLVAADRSRDGTLFSGLVALLVLLVDVGLLAAGRWAARRPGRSVSVRRVVLRRGLLARTWLETDDAWLPVYFEPDLLMLPSPSVVTVRGDRWAAVEAGRMLYPSGRARRTEPRGARTDSPTVPDAYAAGRAAVAGKLWRQVRVDSALAVPAPVVGVLWAYLDDGGVSGWFGATVLVAALALWWAAIRGSDPS